MDPGWFAPLDAYCERTSGGFWAEPLNALSNGAFLIAAAAAGWREREAVTRDPAALGLAALVNVVGIGSFLFHTFAVRWALLADVIPIALFIYAYFLLAMRRFFGLSAFAASTATLAFAGFNLGFAPILDGLTGSAMSVSTNGSIDYVPTVLALFAVGSALPHAAGGQPPAHRSAGRSLVTIGALFLSSLIFRTMDLAACPILPMGTHALWHVLNAVVLYGLIAVAIAFRSAKCRPEQSAPPT